MPKMLRMRLKETSKDVGLGSLKQSLSTVVVKIVFIDMWPASNTVGTTFAEYNFMTVIIPSVL